MICAQAVIHFRPQEAYEKYLKLLVSAMVLIQLFLPVSRILFHGDSEELAMKSQAFLEGLEAEMSAAESKAYETDTLLEQMTLEEVRRRVEEARAAEESGEAGSGGTGTGATGSRGTGTNATGSRGTGTGATGSRETGTGATGSRGTGTGATGIRGTESGETGTDTTDSGEAEAAEDTVSIEQIQVEEIRIRLQTDSGETG